MNSIAGVMSSLFASSAVDHGSTSSMRKISYVDFGR